LNSIRWQAESASGIPREFHLLTSVATLQLFLQIHDVGDEGVDVRLRCLPGAHEAGGAAGEIVEEPAAVVEALLQRFRKIYKDAVGFDRKRGREIGIGF